MCILWYNRIVILCKYQCIEFICEVYMEKIKINTEYIKLDQFLKLSEMVMSGGEAKVLIMSEEVLVNGEVCTQRGKKLRSGDTVEVDGRKISIA